MSVLDSIYKSMTGLLGFSAALNNASNNVSNINTPGYKGQDVFFRELTEYNPGQGNGDNAEVSVGGGVKVEGAETRFKQGDLSTTGNNTDIAIDGNGFFILRGLQRGDANLYTRAGQFQLDSNGVLIDPKTGRHVAGMDSGGNLTDLDIGALLTSPPVKTTSAKLSGNLDSGTSQGGTIPGPSDSAIQVKVIDGSGAVHQLSVVFVKDLGSDWTVELKDEAGNLLQEQSLSFGPDGAINSGATKLSLNYQPFTLLSASQAQSVITASPTYAISSGDVSSSAAQSLTLNGKGYLVARKNNNLTFLSGGALKFDSTGNLIDANSGAAVSAVGSDGTITNFSLSGLLTNGPQATSKVLVTGRLDSTLADASTVPPSGDPALDASVVRADGSTVDLKIRFVKQSATEWAVQVTTASGAAVSVDHTIQFTSSGDLDSSSQNVTMAVPNADGSTFNVTLNLFKDDADKVLSQAGGGAQLNSPVVEDGVTAGQIQAIKFDDQGYANITYSNGKEVQGPRLALASTTPGSELPLAINLSSLTSLSGTSSAKIDSSDGHESGRLTQFAFNEDGTVKLTYSNGAEDNKLQLALANFSNLNALVSAGDASFKAGGDAGEFIGKPNSQGMGALKGGELELSNVDLSQEFADIIIIQRGYQASSQVMNVSNQVIENLYNSIRGG